MSMFCLGSGVSEPSAREVELHEDEVPELDVAVATLAVRAAVGLAAPVLRTAVVVELRARAARAGLPGRAPEVVRAGERDDALPRDSHPLPRRDGDLVLPEAEPRIAREDRRPEPLGLEPELPRDVLPGVVDGAVLEVVAEREVAEHLEHRGVPRGHADLVEIGVLAARAEALLNGGEAWGGRRLRAREVRLERLHPGRDEERRRILRRRDQGEGREAQVLVRLEEREKGLAELGGRAHPDDRTGVVSASTRSSSPMHARRPTTAPVAPSMPPTSPRGTPVSLMSRYRRKRHAGVTPSCRLRDGSSGGVRFERSCHAGAFRRASSRRDHRGRCGIREARRAGPAPGRASASAPASARDLASAWETESV